MTYELTDTDREIIRRTTSGITEYQSDLIAIHGRRIKTGEARRACLLRELEACERALAMRHAAIDALAR